MRIMNNTITAALAAMLCGLALITGCGNNTPASSAQTQTPAQTEATANEEAGATEAVESVETGSAENEAEIDTENEDEFTADDEDMYTMQTNIEGCDTFTQIVDKLEAGKGYANTTVDETDVLLITSEPVEFEDMTAAVDAEVFVYIDGVPAYAGHIQSGGSANPLTQKDGSIYSAGHHFVEKSGVAEGQVVTREMAVIHLRRLSTSWKPEKATPIPRWTRQTCF